jgi:hypothetical protein
MLLTNQKTINYENLSKKLQETTPSIFVMQIYDHEMHYSKQKTTFNTKLIIEPLN